MADRDLHEERRPLAERRAHADLAAEDLAEPARERQAEAGSAHPALALLAERDPLVERLLLIGLRQSRPGVAHLEADGFAVPDGRGGHADVARLRELQGVDDEVAQDL